jgi:hypothetical protein
VSGAAGAIAGSAGAGGNTAGSGGDGGAVAGTGGGGRGGASGGAGGGTTGGRGGAGGGAGGGGGGGRAGGGGAAGARADAGVDGPGGSGGAPGRVAFLPNIRLNDDTGSGNQVETAIATGPSGAVLVGWVDGRSGLRCAYASSTDGGATFSRNVLVMPESGGITGDTTVAIDAAGTFMAICQDYGTSQIRLMTSTDRGTTWSSPRSIQGAPDKPWIGASPTQPGVAFVTWLGNAAGIRRTMDGGMTWGPVRALEFLNHGTTISVGSSGVVHIGYTPNGGPVRYVRSRNLGESWDAARTIAQTGTFCWSDCGTRQHPIMGGGADPTGRYVALTWAATLTGGQGDEDVWVIYSSDSGDTWSQPIKANDNPQRSRQFQPWVAVDSQGRVHAAWTDLRNGRNDTYYARMTNPAMGFEPNVQVNDAQGSPGTNLLDYKGIAIQGSDVMVVFPDMRRGNGDIFFAKAPGAAAP